MKLKYRFAAIFLVFVLALVPLIGCATNSSAPASSGSGSGEKTATEPAAKPAEQPSPEAPKSNFPEKNITFIVPVSPGGGFDTLSRLFVPYWEKNLPNNAKIVVENKPGGEWNIGLSTLYKSDPDGHTVGIINVPGNSINQILGKAQYDLTKFSYIGRINDLVYVLAASKQSGIKSVEDLKAKKDVKAGVVGLSSSAGLGSVIVADRLGLNMTPIPHDGSNEAIISAMQGAVDIVQYPFSSLKKSIVDSDELTPLLVFAEQRLPDLPDVPTVKDIGMEDLLSTIAGHRIVVGPPDIPEDVLKILRDGFDAAATDPEFKEKMLAEDASFNPANAETARKISVGSIDEYAKYKELVEKHLK